MPNAPRLSIFIDGGYAFKVFQPYARLGYRQSFRRLIKKLSLNSTLSAVHYVNSINLRDEPTRKKQEGYYYGYLRDQLRWDVTILPLQWPGGNAEQKGTDSTLTLLLHDFAVRDEYDTAILIAADSDFVPPVERVKTLGKIVRNGYFKRRASFHLQQACNGGTIRLDDIDFVYRDGDPMHLLTLSSLPAPPRRPGDS